MRLKKTSRWPSGRFRFQYGVNERVYVGIRAGRIECVPVNFGQSNMKGSLLKLVNQHFSKLHWKSVRYVRAGYDHDVLILDNKMVFRFPKNNYSREALKGEIRLLGFLKKHISLAIPMYEFVARDYSFGGYQMIKGVGLTPNNYQKLSLHKQKSLTQHISDFVSELHSVPLKTLKDQRIRERFADKEFNKLHKDARKLLYPSVSTEEKSEFELFFSELGDVLRAKYKKVLVHGDLSGDHLIMDSKGRLAGIIDFTDRAIHDPAFDFIYFWEFGPAFVGEIYKNYTGEKRDILQRSKVYAEASALWNMIYAIKMKRSGYNKWYRNFRKLRAY